MSTQYRLVVFDWDGTLMDSEAHIVHSMQSAMRDLGIEVLSPREIGNIIGLGLREAIHTLFPQRGEAGFVESFTERYRTHFFAPEAALELFPGTRETLEALRERGYLLAVATGKGRAGLDRALTETGLGSFFHATRCAEETASKPDPMMLLQLLDQIGVTAQEAVMVGDTEFDLAMANSAGTGAIGVSYGVHERDRLMRHAPLACLDAISELPVVLGNLLQQRRSVSDMTHNDASECVERT